MHFAPDVYSVPHVQENAVYRELFRRSVIFRAAFRAYDVAGLFELLRKTVETAGMSAGKYLGLMRSVVVNARAHRAL